MNSTRSGELISLALQRALTPSCKKHKGPNIDEHIVASARKILSTKIEYVHCPQYSTSSFLESLKSKYPVLKPKRPKKKKRKRNKQRNNENYIGKSPMKDTELNGQNLSLPSPKTVLFSPEAVQVGWRGSLPVGSGFINQGTTCYINSTLQALFHVPSFVNWLMDDKKHHTACEKMNGMLHTECIVCAMSRTLSLSHRASGSTVRPKHIIDKVKTICKHLSPYRQEDAHEFLRYLMEAMEKSYTAILGGQAKKLDSFSKETTPLNQIFGGYIRTEVTCLECSHVSTTFQHFQDLILDIRQASTTTVYDALENYFSKERLDGDESYHCEHCKKKVSAYKKFSVERAPNALCIQLKRFNLNSFGGSKISKSINTPHNIDLSKFKHKKGPFNAAPLKYRLVSMVFHHGSSANSGHYTALGCTASGSYYYFNDEQVFPVHLNNFTNNPNAYIMFYERERSSFADNVNSSASQKSTMNNLIASINSGGMNGTGQQRTNGFLTKREGAFSSSNHSKLSWEKTESKPIPVKPAAAAAAPTTTTSSSAMVVKSTPNSLVPYTQSSDSETSDTESNDRSPSVLSPLAKKNSTLTSLLTSSPKNENATTAYRVTTSTAASSSSSSSPRPLSSCKPLRLESMNGVEVAAEASSLNSTSTGGSGSVKAEKRGIISFNLFGNKKRMESVAKHEDAGKSEDVEKPKSAKQMIGAGVASVYSFLTGGSGTEKKEEEEKRVNGYEETRKEANSRTREGLLANGVAKSNGVVNGTNGWHVTEIEDDDPEMNGDESYSSKSLGQGDWKVTEKSSRKSTSSPSRDTKSSENRKYNGGFSDKRNENSSQSYTQNGFSGHPYSSHNGYGGKVLAWNGDLSKINKDTESERRELCKRSYNHDDEQDRGKIKKQKYYRNENASQSPRKNLVQQFHNHSRGRRMAWGFNQNGYNYNQHRRNPNHNAHFRNHYVHRTNNNYSHGSGGFRR